MAEITEASDHYNEWVEEQSAIARKIYQLEGVISMLDDNKEEKLSQIETSEHLKELLNLTYAKHL